MAELKADKDMKKGNLLETLLEKDRHHLLESELEYQNSSEAVNKDMQTQEV